MSIRAFVEIPIENVKSKMYQQNIELYGEHSNSCLICGKPIKESNPKHVHLLTNGNIVSYDGDDIDNSQGFFPVGKSCAKKLVINFAH
jgi:hypothetical protein